jgi:anti-sigma factor RsiW
MPELNRGEVLDRLPDYVHGTLSADETRVVESALATDPAMRRELDLIRAAREALGTSGARVDVDRVVAALRNRPVDQPVETTAVSSRSVRWRIAAAVATIAIGGASLAVVQRTYRGYQDPPTIVGETAAVANEVLSISFGNDLSTLTSEDLDSLIVELKQSGGLPSAEPKSATVTMASEEIQ